MMIPPARLGCQEAGEAEQIEVAGWAHYYHDWVEAARRGGMLLLTDCLWLLLTTHCPLHNTLQISPKTIRVNFPAPDWIRMRSRRH